MQVISTRKIDELGRLILPTEIRGKLNISAGTPLDICLDSNGQLVLKKSSSRCKICGGKDDLIKYHEKDTFICSNCQKELAELTK